MQPEGSLPHSQASATCPYPVPAQSSSHTHILEIHPNIIHPSTPRSPQWSLSLRFPHQDPIRPPLLTRTRHMPCPSHSSRFYHPHNIGWGVQIINHKTPTRVILRKSLTWESRFSLRTDGQTWWSYKSLFAAALRTRSNLFKGIKELEERVVEWGHYCNVSYRSKT